MPYAWVEDGGGGCLVISGAAKLQSMIAAGTHIYFET
jgi:hypothetical protein